MLYSGEAFSRALSEFVEAPESSLSLTEAGWISLYTHLGPRGGNTMLEDWQILAANNPSLYQYWAKSRQVGFSWVQALQKLARSHIMPEIYGKRYTGIFLSINLEEATNKIRYVMEAWETLPAWLQNGPLKLVSETQKSVEFANGSRLISYPAKAVRGESGADIVMDEAAHIPKAKEIYAGTTSAAIRSETGSIVVGSTPLGETGFFFDLADLDERGAYSTYKGNRYFVYWWDSAALCVDVAAARKRAVEENWVGNRSYEDVKARVEEFGIPRLMAEFEGHSLEDFLQEYEVAYSTVSGALIPRDVILDAVDPEFPQYAKTVVRAKHNDLDELFRKVDEAISIITNPRKSHVVAAYDPARTRDQAAFTITDEQNGRVRVVARISFMDTQYAVQDAFLSHIVADPRIHKLKIDVTGGMGGPIHEKLSEGWGESRVEGVQFNQGSKHMMASKLAAVYSHRKIVHTGDREIIRQVASVRQIPTASGALKYEGGGEGHHADVFWSLAMAVSEYSLLEGDGGGISIVRKSSEDATEGREGGPRGIRDEYREWLRKRREGL